MSQSNAFRIVSEEIERRTALDRLQSRGTLRIALRHAGLEPKNVSPQEMAVVVEKILPGELASRGEPNSPAVCAALTSALEGVAPEPRVETPDDVFARLGGSTTGEPS